MRAKTIDKIMSAVYLDAFSNALDEQYRRAEKQTLETVNPIKKPISETVSTLTKFFINAMSLMTNSKFTNFKVRLANRLFQTAEQGLRLESSSQLCHNDDICENNKLQLAVIADFLAKKFPDILEYSTVPKITKYFEEYYKAAETEVAQSLKTLESS